MKLYVWTVDDPDEARRLFACGADGIATNRAHWLKTRLGDVQMPAQVKKLKKKKTER